MPVTIHLSVPPAIVRQIKAAAKEAFPKETYGLLIGTVAGDHVHIDELYVPDDVTQHTTDAEVNPQQYWMEEAQELAKESESIVCGWFHSHGYTLAETGGDIVHDHGQSEGDIDAHPRGLFISGVCVVQEFMRRGKRTLRASVRFWGPTIKVETKYE